VTISDVHQETLGSGYFRRASAQATTLDRSGFVNRSSTAQHLAASIAHDIRSPLSTIQLGAEILLDSNLSESQIQRLAQNIYESSIRIRELIEELIDLSLGRSPPPELTNLNYLVAHAVAKIANSAKAQSVTIIQNVPEHLEVTLDRQRIHRLLITLFVNALEAMPGGGSIFVSAVQEDNGVTVTVQDTGAGIPVEIQDRIFQPFVTARKKGGLGLGLAFSCHTVLDHGGAMWVQSSNETGACLAFRLPNQDCSASPQSG
jgi:signal transduction histidine kinase